MFYKIIVSLLYKVTLLFSIIQIILALFHSKFENAQAGGEKNSVWSFKTSS